MSYSINVSGHGVDQEGARRAFAELITALDEATGEAGSKASGQLSGTETTEQGVSIAFLVRSDEVRAESSAEEPATTEAETATTEEPAGLAPVTIDTETANLRAQDDAGATTPNVDEALEASVPAAGDTPDSTSSGNAASDTPAEGSSER